MSPPKSLSDSASNNLRFDLKIIADWIEPHAKVIGLGCGDGELLDYLKKHKQIQGTGIDHNEAKVAAGIKRGLSILQGDINEEVGDYPDKAFDFVILSQTLQQIYAPSGLIAAMLRIGHRVIVSFPNFSHWRCRWQLLFSGYAPVTRQLPYQWYDTPNIRVITLRDFTKYAREVGFKIIAQVAVNTSHNAQGRVVKYLKNWRATYGIFLIGEE